VKDLQEATEKICELKGSLVAVDVLLTALCKACPRPIAMICSRP
jgi:hypothetical protein